MGWKRDTDTVDAKRMHALIAAGYLRESEVRLKVEDPESGEPIFMHAGSVHWNEYRKRWVLIGLQIGGKASFIGEVWYAEADRLEGPWGNARHIVTHDHYSFYNPSHHPFLDQEGGRIIYFDGTFSDTFSSAKRKIPRYDYNQIMYRLDLGGKKLGL